MMSSSDKELEQQLMEAGNRLLDPPSSVEELLPLLDQVENCLSRVEQSPSQSMQNALSPSLKALVTEQIFRHADADVKVAVASCISEITRITAPDAPYDDDQMKEVFQLIVSSFENLFDKSSRSYAKRTSILETVAKVRSCVVMLDLECDALIIEMFQHFLKAIRDYHPENVFSSMETIMNLVLEESEDISMELLSPLLACVKRDNEEVMPIAQKLAERVLESCGNKLKPCLTEAVRTLGISLDDYSEVVASICQDTSNNISQDDGAIDNQTANENKPAKACLDDAGQQENIAGEVGPVCEDVANDRSPKLLVNNGIVQEDDSLLDSSLLKKQEHGSEESSIATQTVHQSDNLSSENLVNSDKDEKSKSASKLTEPFDSSGVNEKEAKSLMEQNNERKHVVDSCHEDPSVPAAESIENQQASRDQPSSPKATEGEIDEVASPSSSGPDDDPLKKHGRTKKKETTIETKPSIDNVPKGGLEGTSDSETRSGRQLRKKAAAGVSSEDKIACAVDETKEESTGASDLVAKPLKELINIHKEGTRDSEAKSRRRSGKKAVTGVSRENKTQSAVDESKEESGGASDLETERLKVPIMIQKEGTSDSEPTSSRHSGKKDAVVSSEDKIPSAAVETKDETGGVSDSEVKTPRQSIKKVDGQKDNGEESLSKHATDKKRRSRGKVVLEDEHKSSDKIDIEEIVTSPKSSKQNNDRPHSEETPKAIAKRKASASKEKGSDSVVYDEGLVGTKVKVWWPKDRMFYEGVVDSFDPIKKRHKVLYNDGDEEILNLRKEKWQVIADENGSNEAEGSDQASPNASHEMPPKKKMKTAEQSTKQAIVDDATPKKSGGAANSRSKRAANKSGRKSKGDSKSDSKSKGGSKSGSKQENDSVAQTEDHTRKTVGKSADSASKATGKSKNDDSATKSSKSEDGSDSKKSTKSKQDASKSAKSQQETPKTSAGSKRKASQSGAKSSGNGAKKLKSGSSKANESESGKENGSSSSETVKGKSKARRSESKRSGKRRR